MKKSVLSLVLLSFSFLFVGCSTKEPQIVFKPKVECFKFEKYVFSEQVDIEVPEYILNLAKVKSEELNGGIAFYESQIDRYIAWCKGQEEKAKEVNK